MKIRGKRKRGRKPLPVIVKDRYQPCDGWKKLDRWLCEFKKPAAIQSRFRSAARLLGYPTRPLTEFVAALLQDPEDMVMRLRDAMIMNDPRSETTKAQTIVEIRRFSIWAWERYDLRDKRGRRLTKPNIRVTSTSIHEVTRLGETLTLEQVQRIRDTIDRQPSPTKERDQLLFCLLYDQGMRLSEVLSLRWCDFEADPRCKPIASNGWLRAICKGCGPMRRKISVGTRTLEAWFAYKRVVFSIMDVPEDTDVCLSTRTLEYAYYKASMGGDQADRWLPAMPTLVGAMSPKTLQGVVAQWGHMIGYTPVLGGKKQLSPHDLRHNAITHLIDHGIPDQDIAAFSRHSTAYLVQKYDLKQSVRSMNCANMLGGTRGRYRSEEPVEQEGGGV